MTRIIRGFSHTTGYSCSQCHNKCCATEYELPLFPQETQKLLKSNPFCEIFIKTVEEKNWLLRGDGCPFLNSKGFCKIHKTLEKPLICQIYPLIFWKVKQDQILIWINPCRGNGFQWVSEPENRITNSQIEFFIKKSLSKFNNYLGEKIDEENPFFNIPVERINEENSFFETINKLDLITEIQNIENFSLSRKVKQKLQDKLTQFPPMKDLEAIMNAVLHWLSWSPVGLQFSFVNSKLIFFVAATWVDLSARTILYKLESSLDRNRLLQQFGSFFATAILPTFWEQLLFKTQFEDLKKFARRVIKVLHGDILQEEITL